MAKTKKATRSQPSKKPSSRQSAAVKEPKAIHTQLNAGKNEENLANPAPAAESKSPKTDPRSVDTAAMRVVISDEKLVIDPFDPHIMTEIVRLWLSSAGNIDEVRQRFSWKYSPITGKPIAIISDAQQYVESPCDQKAAAFEVPQLGPEFEEEEHDYPTIPLSRETDVQLEQDGVPGEFALTEEAAETEPFLDGAEEEEASHEGFRGETAGEESVEVDLDSMSHDELVDFCRQHAIPIDPGWSSDEIKNFLFTHYG